MPAAITFRAVRKTFRKGNRSAALRDAIPRLLAGLTGRRAPAAARFVALDGVTFELRPGEALGIVGANGAGKSTALRLAAGIYAPDEGAVEVHGRVSALIELSAGFHPDLSGRENIYLLGALQGLRRREIREVFDRIAEFADIGEFLDYPVRTYSSGMAVRLGFAVAAHVPAEVLLVDEVLAVGDIDFRAKCLRRMSQRRADGAGILFVSHNLSIVEQFCDRVLFLGHGKVRAEGAPREVIAAYRKAMAEEHAPAAADQPKAGRWSPRHGNQAVRLDRIALVGDAGLAPGSARWGGALRVEGTWEAASPCERPRLGVAIHALDGSLCGEAILEEVPGGRLAGAGSFRILIERLAILPGDYEVSVYAKDADGLVPLDVHQRLYPLQVVGEAPPGERGVIALQPRWEIVAGGP